MSDNKANAVSARVQTYSFDNGELRFSIDHAAVEEAITSELIDSLIATSLKTLIHRSTSRPKVNDVDATDWLLEALQGGAAAGRFRVTDDDKERAKNAMKSFKLAPEQVKKQFVDTYGIEFQDDAEFLSKHYMNVRAKDAADKKAKKLML